MKPRKIAVSTRARGSKHEVRAEDARDRAGRAEVRDVRARPAKLQRDDRLQRGRGVAGEQVEDEVAEPAERVLDVVAEDPEEEHVAAEV